MIDQKGYIKKKVTENVALAQGAPHELDGHESKNPRKRGAMIGDLNECALGNAGRHAVLNFLFGKPSTKLLTDEEWFGLFCWIDSYQDDDGWHPSMTFCKECFDLAVMLREEVAHGD